MLTSNGLRFHPIVRHHIPLSRGVDGGPLATLALQVHPGDEHSILLGNVHLPESLPAARGGVSCPESAS